MGGGGDNHVDFLVNVVDNTPEGRTLCENMSFSIWNVTAEIRVRFDSWYQGTWKAKWLLALMWQSEEAQTKYVNANKDLTASLHLPIEFSPLRVHYLSQSSAWREQKQSCELTRVSSSLCESLTEPNTTRAPGTAANCYRHFQCN